MTQKNRAVQDIHQKRNLAQERGCTLHTSHTNMHSAWLDDLPAAGLPPMRTALTCNYPPHGTTPETQCLLYIFRLLYTS